jgi:hypothetical protein
MSGKITIVVADQVYIDRIDLPPAMTARLIRLAAFQNPEFYCRSKTRMQTSRGVETASCVDDFGGGLGR